MGGDLHQGCRTTTIEPIESASAITKYDLTQLHQEFQ